MRRLRWIALRVLYAGLLLASVALLARFVLHGPVNGRSLHQAVVRESGSAEILFDSEGRCRSLEPRGIWTCVVGDAQGSGNVAYRVVVRPGSSCWEGQLIGDAGEGPMPEAIRGCVHLWQWTLIEIVL